MAFKTIQRRTPGGRTAIHRKKKKTAKRKCAVCHGLLHGTPRGSPVEIRKLSKTERRPSRPFGGQLCSRCSRKIVALKAKVRNKLMELKEVPISLRSYLK